MFCWMFHIKHYYKPLKVWCHSLMNTQLKLLTNGCSIKEIKHFQLCCYWKIISFSSGNSTLHLATSHHHGADYFPLAAWPIMIYSLLIPIQQHYNSILHFMPVLFNTYEQILRIWQVTNDLFKSINDILMKGLAMRLELYIFFILIMSIAVQSHEDEINL